LKPIEPIYEACTTFGEIMSAWRDMFFGKVIGRKHVQGKAHAFTLLSMMWSLLSLAAFLVCKGSADPIGWGLGIFVWTLHATFILSAIWLWRYEKKDTEIVIRESLD